MVVFYWNLNQGVQYFDVKQKSHTVQSEAKIDSTFFDPPKFLGKFFAKIHVWANSHLLKTYLGNSAGIYDLANGGLRRPSNFIG